MPFILFIPHYMLVVFNSNVTTKIVYLHHFYYEKVGK